jgi:hypothetical protein
LELKISDRSGDKTSIIENKSSEKKDDKLSNDSFQKRFKASMPFRIKLLKMQFNERSRGKNIGSLEHC